MLRRCPKMAAMLLKSRIAFELFPPRANFPSNLSNLCGSSSILPVETLYGFGFPFRWPSGPFLGQHSTVLGCACLGLGGTASDFSKVQAFSAGGAGGDDGFRGRGDGGSGGDGGEEAGGNWSFLTWYLTSLDKHPVATKAITSAALTLAGDLICQLLMDRVPNLDAKRTLVFTFLGLVLVGPTLHFWYLFLSKLISRSGVSGAFLRLMLDQFIFSPIFIGVFLCALVTLEGRPSEVVPKLQQEWFSSVLANWQLWIPFQFLNFRFVPQKFQVLAANMVALAWNVILSFKAHKEIIVK